MSERGFDLMVYHGHMGSSGLSCASLPRSRERERERECAWVSGIVDILWLCTHLTTCTKPPSGMSVGNVAVMPWSQRLPSKSRSSSTVSERGDDHGHGHESTYD